MPPEIRPSNNTLAVSEEIDAAYIFSIAEAEKFGVPAGIVKAKNKYGHWLMEQREYSRAIPYFQDVAKTQELQNNRIEAAHTYHMLSNCLFFLGDVERLQEANQSIKKAIEFYPDSEEFIELKKTAIYKQLSILNSLATQTKDNDYIKQGKKVYKQYAGLLINDKDKEVQKQLALTGFT